MTGSDRFARYRCIAFERRGRVLAARLNRPEQMNAVDARLHTELSWLFTDLADDPDSDVIVLTGNGRAFCAGGDIDWMQSAIDDPSVFEATAREARRIVFAQLDLDKPLICRLNGHATGLGASLALLSDVVIAHDGVKIGDPHVSIGLVAGDGGALLWPQLVGYAKARRYLLTGDLLPAAEAERIGLLTEVVPRERLDDTVFALADRLAAGAVRAIRWTKLTSNLPLRQLFQAHFDAGVAYEMLSQRSADHREAVAAFRERRAAVFRGD